MNNSNYNYIKNHNYKPIPVKVIYFTEKRIISEVPFFLNSTFYSVLIYFEKNLKEKNTKLKKFYLNNNRIINLNEPLINLVQIKKNSSSSTIESVEMMIEIDEMDILDDENISEFNILIQPKINPYGLFVYKPKEGLISLEHYPNKISKKFELNKFSEYSSYCNSPKCLFISGGKINNSPINDFWIINNEKYNIIKKSMPINKSNHSMLYININNNEYIFIAGGDNNLNTFFFDIKSKYFLNWGNMNSIHIKPALYQYKNFLYCFNSFNKNNNINYFERTNLTNHENIWEKIFPNFDNEASNFKLLSFGVSSCFNENILLVGGENNIKNKCYIYSPIKNLLSLCEKGKNENIELSDKCFYKVNKYHNVALPLTLKTKKEIAVVNKLKQNVRLISFNIGDGISKVKFRNISVKNNKENEYGKIIVNAKINERLRFGFKPEIVSEQNLTISKEPKIIDQEIYIEIKPDINKDKIYIDNSKIKKNKIIFHLSSSLVYDNLIQILVKKTLKNENNYKNKFKMINPKPKDDKDNLSLNKSDPLFKENNINNNNTDIESKFFNNLNNINVENDGEEEDKRQKRDIFENTIKEPLGQDIIMIEEYQDYYYDINNFADYEVNE